MPLSYVNTGMFHAIFRSYLIYCCRLKLRCRSGLPLNDVKCGLKPMRSSELVVYTPYLKIFQLIIKLQTSVSRMKTSLTQPFYSFTLIILPRWSITVKAPEYWKKILREFSINLYPDLQKIRMTILHDLRISFILRGLKLVK